MGFSLNPFKNPLERGIRKLAGKSPVLNKLPGVKRGPAKQRSPIAPSNGVIQGAMNRPAPADMSKMGATGGPPPNVLQGGGMGRKPMPPMQPPTMGAPLAAPPQMSAPPQNMPQEMMGLEGGAPPSPPQMPPQMPPQELQGGVPGWGNPNIGQRIPQQGGNLMNSLQNRNSGIGRRPSGIGPRFMG